MNLATRLWVVICGKTMERKRECERENESKKASQRKTESEREKTCNQGRGEKTNKQEFPPLYSIPNQSVFSRERPRRESYIHTSFHRFRKGS